MHHGDVIIDDYDWLRDKDDPSVIAHLHEENAYTKARTEHLAVLHEQIFDEITSRTKETDLSVPSRRGEWWYYTRTFEKQQYDIHCRIPIKNSDDWDPPVVPEASNDELTDAAGAPLPGEQVLLDENIEAESHDYYEIGSFDISTDGTMMLYGVDVAGDERYTVRLRAIDGSGRDLDDVLENTAAGAILDPSGRYVFYTTLNDSWRPDTIWRHEVGTAASADVAVFHEPDERFLLNVGVTRSRTFIMIQLSSRVTSETLILDATDPTGEFRVVWPRKENVEYDVDHAIVNGEDRLLIVHNDRAVNFELVSVAASDPQGPRVMLLPHDPTVRLEGVDAFRDFVSIEYRRDGLPRVAVANPIPASWRSDAATHAVPPDDIPHELVFDEELASVTVTDNPTWEQPTLRIATSSFVTPSAVYDVVTISGHRLLRKRQPVIGVDLAHYSQRREWAVADDGERIPISLVYRNDLVDLSTPTPTLLYGYGAYELSSDPVFGIPRLSLLDRGMIFAVAHVRGGGEMGRSWYERGKKFTKRHSFTDFVAVARHLIDEEVTAPDRLVAHGGSAGGLLVGAVANIAPRYFSGILAEVPFVDPLTSMLNPSLPLTVIEWDEWGDPLNDPEAYAYIKSYSPVENVHENHYPPILAVTSLNDTRVLYVEPAKWVARLRDVGADPLL